MGKKYELTTETIVDRGHILYRIKSLRYFRDIKYGDLGGFIESEDNLSHGSDCWVAENARVCRNAKIYDKAHISGNATISG